MPYSEFETSQFLTVGNFIGGVKFPQFQSCWFRGIRA